MSAGVIGEAVRQVLVDDVKAVHYLSRTYAELVRLGRAADLPATELDALERWLPSNRIDQKRLDALALLTCVRKDLGTDDGPEPVEYAFNHTVFFETLRRAAPAAATDDGPVTLDELLDELRLDPQTYVSARFRALARLLAYRESAGRGSASTAAELHRAAAAGARVGRGHRRGAPYDEVVELAIDSPVTRPVAALRPLLPRPEQPPGYAPEPAGPTPRP